MDAYAHQHSVPEVFDFFDPAWGLPTTNAFTQQACAIPQVKSLPQQQSSLPEVYGMPHQGGSFPRGQHLPPNTLGLQPMKQNRSHPFNYRSNVLGPNGGMVYTPQGNYVPAGNRTYPRTTLPLKGTGSVRYVGEITSVPGQSTRYPLTPPYSPPDANVITTFLQHQTYQPGNNQHGVPRKRKLKEGFDEEIVRMILRDPRYLKQKRQPPTPHLTTHEDFDVSVRHLLPWINRGHAHIEEHNQLKAEKDAQARRHATLIGNVNQITAMGFVENQQVVLIHNDQFAGQNAGGVQQPMVNNNNNLLPIQDVGGTQYLMTGNNNQFTIEDIEGYQQLIMFNDNQHTIQGLEGTQHVIPDNNVQFAFQNATEDQELMMDINSHLAVKVADGSQPTIAEDNKQLAIEVTDGTPAVGDNNIQPAVQGADVIQQLFPNDINDNTPLPKGDVHEGIGTTGALGDQDELPTLPNLSTEFELEDLAAENLDQSFSELFGELSSMGSEELVKMWIDHIE